MNHSVQTEPGVPRSKSLLGTPLTLTDYNAFAVFCALRSQSDSPLAVDFSNTHVVTMRRHNPAFRELTSHFDFFLPDGMPLIWCLNARGAKLRDRVYGPTFLRRALANSPASLRHYFLGGTAECLEKLLQNLRRENPALQVVGTHHGYFSAAQEADIVDEINQLQPDFIWVGLGTPKQQEWIHRHKSEIRRGVILAVGFAFDVNAGTKPDAPSWMQRCGLTWLYRLASEPRRLFWRYLKYNSLFLFYLLWDGVRGKAFAEK